MHRNATIRKILGILLIGSCSAVCAVADEAKSTQALELFEKEIRPALIEHCIRCHGEEKQQGGLRLDSKEGWAEGGDTGAAIVPGDSDSLLLQAISYEHIELEMPPRGKLPDKTIEAFRNWIAAGALDPRSSETEVGVPRRSEMTSIEEGRQFWSFQPIEHPEIPSMDSDWCETDIDRLIAKKWQSVGLKPTKDASPTVLLRRLYYDLIGLPPTPQQVDDFLNDSSPNAYEKVVDQLLDSPHFGERWGRHWLDVVRFAQSSGGGRTLLFPEAWRYRDYVIESFNANVPYDRFLQQQIAGDLLDSDSWQQQQRNLIATAFLILGPINYEMQDKDILEMDIVDEQIDTIGKAFMGMTIGCARCHDHKFDPIPTADYYALAGILKSTDSVVHSNVSKWQTQPLPLPPEQQQRWQQHQQKLVALKKAHQEAEQAWIDAGGKPNAKTGRKAIDPESVHGIVLDDDDAMRKGNWTPSTSVGRFVGQHYIHDSGEERGQKEVVYDAELPQADRYEVLVSYTAHNNRSSRVPVTVVHADGKEVVTINQRNRPPIADAFISVGTYRFAANQNASVIISNEAADDGVVIADAVVFVKVADREEGLLKDRQQGIDPTKQKRLAKLKAEVERLAAEIKQLEKAKPKPAEVMAVQEADNPDDIPIAIRGQAHLEGERVPRGFLQVASWETTPAVKRDQSGRRELAIWLTDRRHPLTARVMANRVWYWLTGRGIVSSVDNFGTMGQRPTHPALLDHLAATFRQDWSIKQLIRQIVLSRFYRLSSIPHDEGLAVDPDNRHLWRMNRKRLRAEDLRDSLLMVSGQLDDRIGGPNLNPGTKNEYGYQFGSRRRSVYVPVFRNRLPEFFQVFDFADPNIQQGKRASSTVASQALLLMNHPFVIEQAEESARRLISMPLPDSAKLRYAYRQVLGRPPNERELQIARELLDQPVADQDDRVAGWAMLYQTLFQCLDFRYLN